MPYTHYAQGRMNGEGIKSHPDGSNTKGTFVDGVLNGWAEKVRVDNCIAQFTVVDLVSKMLQLTAISNQIYAYASRFKRETDT